MTKYPFDLTVYVYRRPNLRDEGLELEMYLGMQFLRTCFDDMKIDPNITVVNLSFPERWLNIIEQRSIFERAAKYCPNLKSLVIKTHSVYIIQCTEKENCFIVQEGEELMQESTEGKLYFEGNIGGWIDPKGLNVL